MASTILTMTSGLPALPVIPGMLKIPNMSFWAMTCPWPAVPVRGSGAARVMSKG